MAKIIHTGDIHLDSAFTGLPPSESKARRVGLRELVSKIVDIANSENVDVILISGDLFDEYPLHTETEEKLLRDLQRAQMPVFITPGNHDPFTANSPYKLLNFPENVHIFSSNALRYVEIDKLKLRIFGAAYTSEIYDERILADFKVPNDDFANIIMLHSNLYTDGYSPVSAVEIGETGADYVALAHVHKPTGVLKSKNTFYAYCGCPEARDFGEQYETGIYIGEVNKGQVNLERRCISDIRYRDITINIGQTPDIFSILPSPSPTEHLRLTIIGECENPNIESLKKNLSAQYAELAIIDRTSTPRNIWQGIGEDTLRGVFLRKMKTQLEECSDEHERKKILIAVKLGVDAIENRDI